MASTELSEQNYRRISRINWLLAPCLIFLFAWPYYILASLLLETGPILSIAGSLLFAAPFTMTILHGHVTIALGALHRDHYYQWLARHRFTHGLFFHPVMFRTRFRFALLICSLALLLLSGAPF